MKTYFFDFGRNPKISYHELIEVLKTQNKKYNVKKYDKKIAIIVAEDLDTQQLINILGGTRKIGIILGKKTSVNKISFYEGKQDKFNYSISTYNTDVGQLRNHLKQKWKKLGLKPNFVKLKKVAGPTQILGKKLLDIIVYDDLIGKTINVPEMKEYIKKDVSRPVKKTMCMTSIRIAKIMINLSGAVKGDTLLDPFCGLGTILQEADSKGLKTIGCDSNPEMIKDCRKNLENFGITAKLYNCKAQDIGKNVKSVDTIVTEPYLGPFIKEISYAKANRTIKELTYLYQKTLDVLKNIVKKRIVIILPYYHTKKAKVEIKADKLFHKTGLKKIYEFKFKERYHNIGRKIYVLKPSQ